MDFLIIVAVTISISLFIKATTRDIALHDITEKNIRLSKYQFDKFDVFLEKRLLKVKGIHYFIPFENILVSLLYMLSYFIRRKEILAELSTEEIINLPEPKKDFLPENSSSASFTREEEQNLLKIWEEQDYLLKLKQELNDQKALELTKKLN